MAVYTLINRGQLESLLAFYDLGDLVEYSPIKSGTTNSNYQLLLKKDNEHYLFVLTIIENKMTRADIEFCIDYTEQLNQAGLPVANPMFDRHEKQYHTIVDKQAIITPFIQGESIINTNATDTHEQQLTANHCNQLGLALANMHIIGTKTELTRANPMRLEWCHQTADSLLELVDNDIKYTIQDELEYLSKNQAVTTKHNPIKGAIHGDLFCDNILFYNDKLQGIIDFFNACIDFLLYDLAIVVNDWTITPDGQINNSNYNALLNNYLNTIKKDGKVYDNIVQCLDEHDSVWQYMLRRAALSFWLLRLEANLLPKESNIKTVKDPLEYEVKLLMYKNNKIMH